MNWIQPNHKEKNPMEKKKKIDTLKLQNFKPKDLFLFPIGTP